MTKWNEVSKKLPKPNTTIAVRVKSDENNEFITIGNYLFPDGFCCADSRLIDEFCQVDLGRYEITHWFYIDYPSEFSNE